MMTAPVREIFADARSLYDDALEMLAQDRIRNAAEKAWGATRRATDALILARTGELPQTTAVTSRTIRSLGLQSSRIEDLVGRYYIRIGQLHGECFYNGNCDAGDTESRIRDTVQYIQDAEALAHEPLAEEA